MKFFYEKSSSTLNKSPKSSPTKKTTFSFNIEQPFPPPSIEIKKSTPISNSVPTPKINSNFDRRMMREIARLQRTASTQGAKQAVNESKAADLKSSDYSDYSKKNSES